MTVRELIEDLMELNPMAVVVRKGGDHAYLRVRNVEVEAATREAGGLLFERGPKDEGRAVEVAVLS